MTVRGFTAGVVLFAAAMVLCLLVQPDPTGASQPEPPSQPTAMVLVDRYDPWAPVRHCESTGDYGAINWADTDGTPSYGGYQFKVTTWDLVARYAGRTHLIGVRPDHATPADQDTQAETLRTMPGGGLGHWPHCGKFYGLTYRGVASVRQVWVPVEVPEFLDQHFEARLARAIAAHLVATGAIR